jgi:hypothetical protein
VGFQVVPRDPCHGGLTLGGPICNNRHAG